MPATNIPVPIGGKIDELWLLREEKRALAEQIKSLDESIGAIEAALMQQLDGHSIRKSEGAHATASITENVIAHVVDWDAFFAFVGRRKLFHLLQRRVSDPAVREMFQQKGADAVPGVQPFVKRSINLRSL